MSAETQTVAKCMKMITPEAVIAAIDSYYAGGRITDPTRNGKKIVQFNHGVGDTVQFMSVLELYREHGHEFIVSANPDKRELFELGGIETAPMGSFPVIDHPHLWKIGSPKWDGWWHSNKVLANFPPKHLHPVMRNEDAKIPLVFAQARARERFKVPAECLATVDSFLEKLPGPIIALHTIGNSYQDSKSIPQEQHKALYESLLGLGASVILLDWDRRAPRIKHPRFFHMPDDWKKLSLPELVALCMRVDLVVGIDSGPLHVAEFVGAPALGLWQNWHHPGYFSIPRLDGRQCNLTANAEWRDVDLAWRSLFDIIHLDRFDPATVARVASDMLDSGDDDLMPRNPGRRALMRHLMRLQNGGMRMPKFPPGEPTPARPVECDRGPTFARFLRLLDHAKARCVVETGSIRQREDWPGAGYSTYFLALWLEESVGRFAKPLPGAGLWSVDINPQVTAIAKDETACFGSLVNCVTDDSVHFLNTFPGPGTIDGLLLDSMDTDFAGNDDHCLAEIQAAAPKLARSAPVMIDDTFEQDGRWFGKGAKAIPWMLANGWKIDLSRYATILVRG